VIPALIAAPGAVVKTSNKPDVLEAIRDDRLRRFQHANTVGLLLVTENNEAVVRFSLKGQQTPVAVSSYDLLPRAETAALPSEEVLVRTLARAETASSHGTSSPITVHKAQRAFTYDRFASFQRR
jgi:hypothetical protein